MQCPDCHHENPARARFCSSCGKPIPQNPPSGINMGNVGMIKELHIGTEKAPPAPGGDYCPICGVWVKVEDSFRCRQCGRTGLHREHREPELNLCSECAEQVRPAEPVRKQPNKAVSQENEQVLTLATGVEMTFRRVPAGAFTMGSTENDKDEKPQHKVHLEEYWIAKTPVTNAQYRAFVEASGHAPPILWEDGKFPKGKEEHPVVLVTWQDGRDFCAWAGEVTGETIRLPSEAEWEKAARGTDGRVYPWGNQVPDVDLCNFGWNVDETTRVGRYSPQGDSPYGCVDMAGNVWEWTSSLWGKDASKPDYGYPYRAGDGREDPDAEGLRVLRGGSWNSNESDVRSSYRYWRYPDGAVLDVGFRCVRSLP